MGGIAEHYLFWQGVQDDQVGMGHIPAKHIADHMLVCGVSPSLYYRYWRGKVTGPGEREEICLSNLQRLIGFIDEA